MARCCARLELALARAHSRGTTGADRGIADVIAATDIAVDGNIRVLLPSCFETMSEVVAAPAEARWLRQAATQLRHCVGLAAGPPAGADDVEQLVKDAPQTAVLFKFRTILRSVATG